MPGDATGDTDDEDDVGGAGHGDNSADDADQRLLITRSPNFLFKRICRGMRLWKRPPHNYCARCGEYHKGVARVQVLQPALLSLPSDPEYATYAAVVERAGGSVEAYEELRRLLIKLPDLKKHMDWQSDQRPYSKRREEEMTPEEATL